MAGFPGEYVAVRSLYVTAKVSSKTSMNAAPLELTTRRTHEYEVTRAETSAHPETTFEDLVNVNAFGAERLELGELRAATEGNGVLS